jgi:transcription termination factor Rho
MASQSSGSGTAPGQRSPGQRSPGQSSPGQSGEAQPFGAGVENKGGASKGARSGKRGKRAKRSSRRRAEGDAPRDGDRPADGSRESSRDAQGGERSQKSGEGTQEKRRRGRRGGKQGRRSQQGGGRRGGGQGKQQGGGKQQGRGGGGGGGGAAVGEVEGLLVLEKANHAHLRLLENQYLPTKRDVHVSPRLVQKFQLRDGSIVKGTYGKGQGKHKFDLREVLEVDGLEPAEASKFPTFKSLTSIDPDFHYEVGDPSGDVSMRVLDVICPVGRGQRGLIVAPPRAGKTILLQKFAQTVEQAYPDVHLIVLLVDERPEEATEWKRTIEHGEVFVSTNDEMAKVHVELAESVWRRCQRLVEMGEDVIVLLDSITRLARAYNHVHGSSGKTMSGGLDSRAMERPRQFFGSARNTETAGSLTILGTTLIETGSRMDQMIFEEFKGTGNMELVLSRKLADRRIFPAIDVERSGTRKEEKLLGKRRNPWVATLRRVLARMHFAEAMDLLITRLDDVEKTDDFLKRFEIDPDA